MYQIKSYLQYKNTPDGKPRVLRQDYEYNFIHSDEHLFLADMVETLHISDEELKDSSCLNKDGDFVIEKPILVASLSDCRPLLTAKISVGDKVTTFRELQCIEYVIDGKTYYALTYLFNGAACIYWGKNKPTKFNFGTILGNYIANDISVLIAFQIKSCDFEDNPSHYSKLLWNCSEQEGWDKIYKLLNIK